MSEEKIIIVNNKDKIIGYKKRNNLKQTDIYRVSALWIQDSNGNILLAQRSFNKKNDPGLWGPAVAGTVNKGESYETNIIKEAKEEIGLKNCFFQKKIHYFRDGKNKHFTQWFFALVDKKIEEFTIQKNEVEKIKWFTKKDLLKELNNSPDKFLKSISKCINLFNK
jgi:isopentenyl-diphosphate Delta-isomerase